MRHIYNNIHLCASNKCPPAVIACVTNTISLNNKEYIYRGCHALLEKQRYHLPEVQNL